MSEEKEIRVDVKEKLIIKVVLPDPMPSRPGYILEEFSRLVHGILSIVLGEYYERPDTDGTPYLIIRIRPDRRPQLYNLLAKFCKFHHLAFKPPKPLRSKEEIQMAYDRTRRAVDNNQRKAARAGIVPAPKKGKAELHYLVARDQAILHALSWVLNEEDIGQIPPN